MKFKEGEVNLGYSEEMIKEMYFSRPNVLLRIVLLPFKVIKRLGS